MSGNELSDQHRPDTPPSPSTQGPGVASGTLPSAALGPAGWQRGEAAVWAQGSACSRPLSLGSPAVMASPPPAPPQRRGCGETLSQDEGEEVPQRAELELAF